MTGRDAAQRVWKRRHDPRLWLPGAALAYLVVDLAIWRLHTVAHLTSAVVGSNPSNDYQVMTWSLEWWPWAFAHAANPLHTGLLWAPREYSTAWMTSIPALSLIAMPLTILAGPLASYNVLMLAAPVCAALAAFALCRELTGRFLPSLVGGYVFGFSAYLLGQALSQHLNLATVFPLPLLVLVAVRRVRGRMSRGAYVVQTALLMLVLAGSSFEVMATACLLGGIVFCVALAGMSSERTPLLRVGLLAALAAVIAGVAAAPFVWLTFFSGRPPLPYPPDHYATDLANLIVPTRTMLGGTTTFALAVSRRFVGNVGEQGAYLGAPLLVVCVLAVVRDWRRTWLIGTGLTLAIVLSLGPELVVAGHAVGDLPVALERLPVFALALPSRLAVYSALAAAILAASWLSRPGHTLLRTLLGLAIVVSLSPQLGALVGHRAMALARLDGSPAFGWQTPRAPYNPLAPGLTVRRGQIVLVLPFGGRTPASYWQAASGMAVRFAGAYTPFTPPTIANDPTILGLQQDSPPPLGTERLRAYLLHAHVDVVLLIKPRRSRWLAIVRAATSSAPLKRHNADVFQVRRRLRHPDPLRVPLNGDTPLSPAGQDAATLHAVGDASLALAAWLGYDTEHHVGRVWSAANEHGRWQPAQPISSNRYEASNLSLAQRDGTGIAAWTENRNGTLRVEVARRTRATGWSTVRPSGQTPTGSVLSAAAGRRGSAIVLVSHYVGARRVLSALRIDTNGRALCCLQLSPAAHDVNLAVANGADRLWAAWREQDATTSSLRVASLAPDGAWQASTRSLATVHPATVPVIAATGRNALLAWTHRGPGHAGVHAILLRSEKTGILATSLPLQQPATLQRHRPAAGGGADTSREGHLSDPAILAHTDGSYTAAWEQRRSVGAAIEISRIRANRIARLPPLTTATFERPQLLEAGARTLVASPIRTKAGLVLGFCRPRNGPWQRALTATQHYGETIIPGPGGLITLRTPIDADRARHRVATLTLRLPRQPTLADGLRRADSGAGHSC